MVSGCRRGDNRLCTVTLMDTGERLDSLLKHSSVKICPFESLCEPKAESVRLQKMRKVGQRDGWGRVAETGEKGEG